MTKSELKSGMIVELRNGEKRIVILGSRGGDILGSFSSIKGFSGTWGDLCSYDEDLLKRKGLDHRYDIMKVYESGMFVELDIPGCLLWEREEVKEVTMKEVEMKFGCKVKIVDSKDE